MVDYGSLPGSPTSRIPAQSSEIQTGNYQVAVEACIITCVKIFTNGSNDGIVEIFDSASGEVGNAKDKWMSVGAQKWDGGNLGWPLLLKNGCYAKLTGTGASYVIHYVDLKRG